MFLNSLRRTAAVVGMIHVQALPGTPRSQMTVSQIVEAACKDAEIYKKCKVDAVLVENMHDVPYLRSDQLGPEVTASMSVVCSAVRHVLAPTIPCGVQVLAGGNRQALAVAQAAGLDFIRAEGFVFAHVADEGITNSCAGDLLRYRANIGADHVQVFADIKKKHCAHALTSDVSVEETAHAAEFFGSDAVIVTGSATGQPASPADLAGVQKACRLPVLVGSGVTVDNVQRYAAADGLIIGSHFKIDGRWQNEICEERVLRFMERIVNLRKTSV